MTRGFGAVGGLGALVFILACGGIGGGGGGGGSKYGSVEFRTYKGGRTRLAFGPTSVKRSWSNMNGEPVKGSYTHEGEEITISWDPNAENYTGRTQKLKQIGPCSIVSWYVADSEGNERDDDVVFEQVEPRCDTVQLR